MPIKFKCPNPDCQKTLSVKDQLAGKKATCPSCKQVLTIPATPTVATAPVARAADVEDLAASFLSDAPKEAPVQAPKTVDFNCPYCDEALHLDAELAGRQAPCPECRRIIKVPRLVEKQKIDWRNAASDIPSGARRDTEPAPEGAWGSTSKTIVSKEALVEADAVPARREPVTMKQWILRGTLAASAVGVLVFGTLLVLNWLSGKRQEKMLAKAMAAKVEGPAAAVISLAAGQFHLRRNEKDSIKPEKGDRGAWNQFGAARNRLAAGATPECDALLVELALAQLGMAGSPAEVAEGKRMSWPDTIKEVGQTLLAIHQSEQREDGVRRVTRKLIAAEQAPLARELARQLGAGAGPFAVVGLEYLRTGRKDDAEKVLREDVMTQLSPMKGTRLNPKPRPRPLTGDMVALMVALGCENAVPKQDSKEIVRKDTIRIGKVAGRAWLGQFAEARTLAAKGRIPLVKLRGLVAAAAAPGLAGTIKPLVEDALKLAETEEALPGWLMVRLVRAGLRAGVGEDKLLALGERLARNDGMRGWVEMPVFRARLAETGGKDDEALLDVVAKGTLANARARTEWVRHKTLKGGKADKVIDSWDEALRPFGYAGVALGLQGGK